MHVVLGEPSDVGFDDDRSTSYPDRQLIVLRRMCTGNHDQKITVVCVADLLPNSFHMHHFRSKLDFKNQIGHFYKKLDVFKIKLHILSWNELLPHYAGALREGLKKIIEGKCRKAFFRIFGFNCPNK